MGGQAPHEDLGYLSPVKGKLDFESRSVQRTRGNAQRIRLLEWQAQMGGRQAARMRAKCLGDKASRVAIPFIRKLRGNTCKWAEGGLATLLASNLWGSPDLV